MRAEKRCCEPLLTLRYRKPSERFNSGEDDAAERQKALELG